MFRGRENSHPERGRALLKRVAEDLGELATVEQEPLQEGRNMHMLVAPTRAAAADESPPNGQADSPEAKSA
jgi:translation initiation factor IF-3